MTWLALGVAVVLVLVIKDARDQRAHEVLLRDARVRFEAYCDRLAVEREHAL